MRRTFQQYVKDNGIIIRTQEEFNARKLEYDAVGEICLPCMVCHGFKFFAVLCALVAVVFALGRLISCGLI
jgi:hypothetical protein